jgi:hypothetical protein
MKLNLHRKAIFWLMGLIVLAPAIPRAEASMMGGKVSVLFSESELITGSEAKSVEFTAPGAGNLFLTLTDLDFPNPFASLKFALTDTVSALVGLATPSTLTLDLTKATTLYAEVFATAAAGTDIGLYNLTATFVPDTSPVPLPASGTLLLSGVTALALGFEWFFRRRTRGGGRHPAGGS